MRRVRIVAAKAAFIFLMGLLHACGGGGGGASNPGSVPIGSGDTGGTAPAKSLDVIAASVVDGAQGVAPTAKLVMSFSAPVSAGLGSAQVQLSDGSKTYPVTVDIAGATVTVTPSANLHT